MTRFVGRVAATRSAAVLFGVAALTVAAAVPAHAAYESGGRGCREGVSGRACAHVEIDRSTGNIRARGAGDAFPASGNVIVLDSTLLERRITERSTGQQTYGVLDTDERDVATSNPVVSQIAGPLKELCDNRLITVEYRATLNYNVTYTTGTSSYSVNSGWRSGRC